LHLVFKLGFEHSGERVLSIKQSKDNYTVTAENYTKILRETKLSLSKPCLKL